MRLLELQLPLKVNIETYKVNKFYNGHYKNFNLIDKSGEFIGEITVWINNDSKIANIKLSKIEDEHQKQGAGYFLYKYVINYFKNRKYLAITSDPDGSTSSLADKVWIRLIKDFNVQISNNKGPKYIIKFNKEELS